MVEFFEQHKSKANCITYTILFDGLGHHKNETLIDHYF